MTGTPFQAGEDFARAMDARDPLAHFRDRFLFPKTKAGGEIIYLCGHSLGLQPKTVRSSYWSRSCGIGRTSESRDISTRRIPGCHITVC